MIFKLTVALLLLVQLIACQDTLPLKLLDETLVQATGARCMDGTPAGYYYSKGSVPNKWLISLEGGGLCLDQKLCTTRSMNELGSSNYFNNPIPGRTAFSGDPVLNPAFWNWTRVHIPYCSSDLWTGTRKSVSNDTYGFYFAGHLIVEGVIQDIMNNYDIVNATEIVVRGGSAGALGGVTSNIDWFNKKFPNAQISGLMNAGWFTDFTPSWSGPSFPQMLAYGSVLYQSRVNEACAAANPGNETYCLFPRYAWNYLPNRLFSMNSLIDTSMLGNLGFSSAYSDPNAPDYLIKLGHYANLSIYTDFVRDPLVDGLFLTTCLMHGLDDTMVIQGRMPTEAIYNWYYRVQNAPRVTYDECTIESVVALISSNNSLLNDCPAVMAMCEKVPSPNVFELAIESASQQPNQSPAASDAPNAVAPSSTKTPVTSSGSAIAMLWLLLSIVSVVLL